MALAANQKYDGENRPFAVCTWWYSSMHSIAFLTLLRILTTWPGLIIQIKCRAFTDPTQALLFNEKDSPFYYQGYYDGTATSEQVEATLAKFGVHTIITGHTLQPEATAYFDGKVISVNIDPESINAEGLFMMRKRIYRITKEGKREKNKKR